MMHPTVSAAWPSHVEKYEGRLSWMYLDTKNKVTTGTGNLIDSVGAAQALPWYLGERLATPDEITKEWAYVKSRTDLAPRSGWAFSAVTKLRLKAPEVDRLLADTTLRFWSDLARRWPVLDTTTADAQLAALDLAWQNGPAFLDIKKSDGSYIWPNMRAAFVARDWTAAASAVPGTGDRANGRKRLFVNAATVERLSLDPRKLWDTETPKGTTMRKYNTNYKVWRDGNMPLQTIQKLEAIPSPVRLTQGGLSFAPASSMTHARLGVFDLNTDGMSKSEVWEMCRELWEVNIIPCPRGFSNDSFQGRTISNTNDGNEHLHCLDLDEIDSMHPEAQAQVREILAGGDGLMGNRSFVGPTKKWRTSWSASMYNPKSIRPVDSDYYINVAKGAEGLGLTSERKVRHERERGYRITGTRKVYRWGRWNVVTQADNFYAESILSKTDPTAPPVPTPTPAPIGPSAPVV